MEQKKVKKGAPPPRYDAEFKAGAVRLVTEQGRQPTEVAKELGICIDTLRSWLRASGVQLGEASWRNREQQRIRELEAEVRGLRKRVRRQMKLAGISSCQRRACKATTNSKHSHPIAPNFSSLLVPVFVGMGRTHCLYESLSQLLIKTIP